ncbi:ABC transporter substrate-binding protein [Marinobacter xestospongiae]|uniref:ABC transporter substrate-binding protein n=1 Tax=Marinobacter xestospongiae TaxID=994319 RepID=A0ABU3VZI1_9GAMM|nr:ABC transporter substrate-binding protein [Marinobacter xestospongiae]MDV2079698.1 ABC transporter substrate-binding protein [Marinobacter xestospongiae]
MDVLGNRISPVSRPRRILVLDAVDLYAVSALVPEPAEHIIGVAGLARLDLGKDATKLAQDMPVVGKLTPDTVSVEAILALQPDLVVASAYMLPPDGGVALLEHLRQSGIPVAWTSGHDVALPPAESLQRVMTFWGEVLGQQTRAEELVSIGLARLGAVRTRTRDVIRPRVFMEIMTTYNDCCWSAGRAFWGPLFDLVGGELLAISDGWGDKLSVEGLMALAPEVYVATGGSYASHTRPPIGPGLDRVTGQAGLQRAANRLALASSPAVKNGRVHGIWSGLASSPLFMPVLAECLGKWLHPHACEDLSPTRTLRALNRYLSYPLSAPLWLSLEDK